MVILDIICMLLLAIYLAFNITIATEYTTSEMKEDFIDEQHLIGKIFANAFYSFAWLCKGIKFVVNKYIA